MKAIKGRFLEDWEINEDFETGSRTITETDIVTFAGLSGDFNPLHMNEEFAKNSVFGTRVAHGFLSHSISIGLINQTGYFDGTIMAQLGHNNITFTKEVIPGDTIRVKCKVTDLRETSRPDRGIITFEATILNQRDEVVGNSERMVMLKRKPR